jgi:cell division protein ZapD
MTAAMEPVIYEQPVNEHVRVCLRLEQLFNQTLHWMRGTSAWDSRAAISALLEILNVLDRPDLKAKLVKELSRYSNVLTRLAENPHIDRKKLTEIKDDLEHCLHQLHNVQGRIAQHLRDNDFLTSIRQYLLNPGGGCSFEVPGYHFWLQQSPAERIAQLTHWFSNLRVAQNAINLALHLIRQGSPPQVHEAIDGFYQSALDSQASCQLIRVALPHGSNVYPEISVGRHGISIRFYVLSLGDRPKQTNETVRFQLTCCVF